MAAVLSLNGDKAPVPDGFTLAFFQKCWCVVKRNLMNMLDQFYKEGTFERSFNATLVALVPKKGDALDVKDFR